MICRKDSNRKSKKKQTQNTMELQNNICLCLTVNVLYNLPNWLDLRKEQFPYYVVRMLFMQISSLREIQENFAQKSTKMLRITYSSLCSTGARRTDVFQTPHIFISSFWPLSDCITSQYSILASKNYIFCGKRLSISQQRAKNYSYQVPGELGTRRRSVSCSTGSPRRDTNQTCSLEISPLSG